MVDGNLTYELLDLPTQVINEAVNASILAIPKIVAALLILLLGWLIAKLSEKIVFKLMNTWGVDKWIAKVKLKESLFNISVEKTTSIIIKYYIIVVFLKEAASRVTLQFLTDLLDGILTAIPSIILGSVIVIITLILGDFFKKKIKKSKFPFKETVSGVVYSVTLFFGMVIALPKFGLENIQLIEDSFRYIVLGLSLGFAIAIGIGFGWAIKEGPAKNFFKRKR
jgi:cellobiose-specific phosphotransferase system component IIC